MHARTEDLLKIRDGVPVDAKLRERVMACPRCSGELERLRRMKLALRELPELVPPAGVWERVVAEAADEPKARPRGSARPWPLRLAAAAALVAAVAVGLLVQAPRTPELELLVTPDLPVGATVPVRPPADSDVSDGAAAEFAPAEGVASDLAPTRSGASDRVVSDRAGAQSVVADTLTTDRAATERAAADTLSAERAAAGNAAAETFVPERMAPESPVDERIAREGTRVVAPLLTFQADASRALTAAFTATPPLELPPAYAALVAESARLERLLAELPRQRRLMSADTAGTIAALEDRVAWLDEQLTVAAARGLEPRERQALWSERVDVMSALVQVRYAQAW